MASWRPAFHQPLNDVIIARSVDAAFDSAMHRRHVPRFTSNAHRFTREKQGVRHRHRECFSRIWDRIIRECRVAATAKAIAVPRTPFGPHEAIADPLIAEHMDEFLHSRDQSSFRIVLRARFLVNSELPLRPNRSR